MVTRGNESLYDNVLLVRQNGKLELMSQIKAGYG